MTSKKLGYSAFKREQVEGDKAFVGGREEELGKVVFVIHYA